MAYVPIPKDLKRVKTKVAFNLTKRQLIGFTLAGLVGIPVYLFMRKFVANDIAILFLLLSSKVKTCIEINTSKEVISREITATLLER